MSKTINFLKSWIGRIATHPTTVKAAHTFWQSFLATFLVGIFAVKDSATLYSLVVASLATGFSALKSSLMALRQPVTIPGEEA